MTVFCNGCGFFPLSGSRCFASSGERCYARSVAAMRRRSTPGQAAGTASGVASARDGISARCTKVSYSIGASFGRFSWAFDRAIAHGGPRTSQVGYVGE